MKKPPMTEHEAHRLLNEHRAVRPSYVRGSHRYTIREDGRVEIERAVGKSGLRWTWELTAARDSYSLPSDIRAKEPSATNAADPSAQPTGTPTPRESTSRSS